MKLLVLLVLVLAVEAETVKFYYVFKDIEFDIGVDIGDDGVVGVGKVIEFCRFMGGMYRNFVKFYKLLSKYWIWWWNYVTNNEYCFGSITWISTYFFDFFVTFFGA